jgi:hypothetical protein
MASNKLKKESRTLNVDRRIKGAVIKEAKRLSVYPVELIESMVREKFNPFGHTNIKDEAAYVRRVRDKDRNISDKKFLDEIRRWEKINS